mgnify:CR=1 FL=1
MSVDIDRESEPGPWRAARNPDATCAVCRQTTCSHPDLIYKGLVPARKGAPCA